MWCRKQARFGIFLHDRRVKTLFITLRTASRSDAETKGPKYVASPVLVLRANPIRGNGSRVSSMYANRFASLRSMLYFGWCFLIRLFSRINASVSVLVTMTLTEAIRATRFRVFGSWSVFWKYEVTLF